MICISLSGTLDENNILFLSFCILNKSDLAMHLIFHSELWLKSLKTMVEIFDIMKKFEAF